MRSALRALLLTAVGVGGVATAEDSAVQDRVFVELVAPRGSFFVREVIPVRLRFGVESEFRRKSLAQLFQRELDVPVQVQASWRKLAGVTLMDSQAAAPDDGAAGVTFALDDGVSVAMPAAEIVRDGRRFDVWEIERRMLPERAGELSIPAPTLRFAYASRFDDDFVQGRVAAERRDASVSGAPLTVTIRPLPEEGRPQGFTGPVGRFSVSVDVDRRDVGSGESLKLFLSIEGDGDLDHFDAPRLDGMPGFHLQGVIESRSSKRRLVTYDLVPVSEESTEVLSFPFAFFDPGPPAAYRVVRTPVIPLRRPPPRPRSKVPRVTDPPRPTDSTAAVVIVAIVVALAVGALVLSRLRARRSTAVDVEHARVSAAATAFRSAIDRPGADVADLLASFLAECLRCLPAAVVTPDLAARLVAAAVEPRLAARTASLLEALVAARYGGGLPSEEVVDGSRTLVGELETAFLRK